jgi:circadian clock protein KaiB
LTGQSPRSNLDAKRQNEGLVGRVLAQVRVTSSESERPILFLRLFTVNETACSVRARRQLERLQQQFGQLEIEVIDVLERPDLAEEEAVLATPALIRSRPLPRRKIIGDLSDWEAVVASLNLHEAT